MRVVIMTKKNKPKNVTKKKLNTTHGTRTEHNNNNDKKK